MDSNARWIFAFLIAVAMGISGCGGSDKTPVHVLAGTRGSTPGSLSTTGFESTNVQLSDRRQPLVLSIGENVLVFGGYTSDDSGVRSLGDGALYDRSRAAWSPMPDAPFSRPLYQAMGVWTGQEAIILGTPCGSAGKELESPDCGKVVIEAAAFSPRAKTWRTLDAVTSPISEQGYVLQGAGLGWTGREAVFSVGHGMIAENMLIDPASGGGTRFSTSPDRVDATCVAGGSVVAVQTGEVFAGGGVLVPNPAANAEPLRTYTLDQKTLSWSAPVETQKPDSVSALNEKVVCSAGQLAYLPFHVSTGFSGGLWWNAAREVWEAIPALKPTQYPSTFTIGEVDGTKVAWLGSSLFILKPGESTWAADAAPLEGMVTLDESGSALLVNATTDLRSSEPLTVGFLDPVQYLASHP